MKQEAIKVWEKHSSSLTAVLECPYSNSVFNRNRRTRNERAHINFLHVKSHYLYFFLLMFAIVLLSHTHAHIHETVTKLLSHVEKQQLCRHFTEA